MKHRERIERAENAIRPEGLPFVFWPEGAAEAEYHGEMLTMEEAERRGLTILYGITRSL